MFCLKEHLKAQGMMGLFFLIKPLFGQNTASYMIWLPFFDTFFSHWTCDLFFALKKDYFKKRAPSCPAAWDALSNKNKILIYWTNQDRKIWDAKWVIFYPCLVHISRKPKDFGLKILWKSSVLSPNISWKFHLIWMFLGWNQFLRGEGP